MKIKHLAIIIFVLITFSQSCRKKDDIFIPTISSNYCSDYRINFSGEYIITKKCFTEGLSDTTIVTDTITFSIPSGTKIDTFLKNTAYQRIEGIMSIEGFGEVYVGPEGGFSRGNYPYNALNGGFNIELNKVFFESSNTDYLINPPTICRVNGSKLIAP